MTKYLKILFLLSLGMPAQAAIPEHWMSLLKEVVEINSGTQNVEGSEKVRALFIKEFEKLGYIATTFDMGQGHKVVSFDYPKSRTPKIIFSGHIDTVFTKDSPFQKLVIDGDKVFGPGIIDMKGGVVLMANVLSELNEELRRQIRIVLNDDEETGSTFSNDKLKELAHGVPFGLVFEPGVSNGNVVSSLAGVHWIELIVHGRAAHAGSDHKKGLNACVALAEKIAEISKFTNYSKNLTVNIGMIGGGTKLNVVCEAASAKIDIRFVNPKDLDKLLHKIQAVVEKKNGVNSFNHEAPVAELKTIVHVPSLTDHSSKELLAIAKKAASSVGLKIEGQHMNYSGDANRLVQTGIRLLVGLGPYGEGYHTDKEFLNADSYPARLQFNKAFVEAILTSKN